MATATRTKKIIKTYWSGMVQTFQPGPEQTRGGVSASIRGDTVSGLMTDAFQVGSYYLAQGYRVEIQHI